MSDVYALKHPRLDGGEWIQEHNSLEDALRFQSDNGGVLVRREQIPGQAGLWWVEVQPRQMAACGGCGGEFDLADSDYSDACSFGCSSEIGERMRGGA